MKGNVVHNFAVFSLSDDAMVMPPGTQEKGKPLPFIHERNFLSIAPLPGNQAIPTLMKQAEVEFQLYHVAFLAAVEPEQPYGWERWAELQEQFSVESFPHLLIGLLDLGTEDHAHGYTRNLLTAMNRNSG